MAEPITVSQWVKEGRPGPYADWKRQRETQKRGVTPITGVSPRTQAIAGTEVFREAEKRRQELAQGMPEWMVTPFPMRPLAPEEEVARIKLDRDLFEDISAPTPFPGQEGGRDIVTLQDGSRGFWTRDPVTKQPKWNQLTGPTPTPAPLPTGLTPFQESQQEATRRARETQQEATRATAQFREAESQRAATAEAASRQQQQAQFQAQLQFQQEQVQQQAEMQRQQEMARLAANPISWLQYAAFTGTDPLTQQWMVPLGMQQSQVGQPIPGFQQSGGTSAGGTASIQGADFSGLPQLTIPSAQLQARWGPTAQAQFLGFERARTGASPQETQFRLGSGRAPGGRFGGFSRFR